MTICWNEAEQQLYNYSKCYRTEIIGVDVVETVVGVSSLVYTVLLLLFIQKIIDDIGTKSAAGKKGRMGILLWCCTYCVVRIVAISCNQHNFRGTCKPWIGDFLWTLCYMLCLDVHVFTCLVFLHILRVVENPFSKKQSPLSRAIQVGGVATLACLVLVSVAHFYGLQISFIFTQLVIMLQIIFMIFVLQIMGKSMIQRLQRVSASNTSLTSQMLKNMDIYKKGITIIGSLVILSTCLNIAWGRMDICCITFTYGQYAFIVLIPLCFESASMVLILVTVRRPKLTKSKVFTNGTPSTANSMLQQTATSTITS